MVYEPSNVLGHTVSLLELDGFLDIEEPAFSILRHGLGESGHGIALLKLKSIFSNA